MPWVPFRPRALGASVLVALLGAACRQPPPAKKPTVQAQLSVATEPNHAPVLSALTAQPPTVQKGGTI